MSLPRPLLPAVLVVLAACDGTPLVFPYPPSAPVAAPVAFVPSVATPRAPASRPSRTPVSVVPLAPSSPPPPPRESPLVFHVGQTTVTAEVDSHPLPLTRDHGGRWSFGPGGEVVLDHEGREAWIAGGATEELTGEPVAHARVTSALPAGLRLLPVLGLEDRGCFAGRNWALVDARAGRAYTEGRDPDRLELAPGVPPGADVDATVLLRFARRSPRSGRERLLAGPREAVEAAPSGQAPGGWLLFREAARVAGRPISRRRASPAAPGLHFATVRAPLGDRLGLYRFWMDVDGRSVEAFDAELEFPEGGVGGAWRSGDEVVLWLFESYTSSSYFARIDARTGARLEPPVALTVEPDWDLCSAAALHDNRLLAVLGDDGLDFAYLGWESEDSRTPILFEGPGRMGRVVPAKLPALEQSEQYPPVLQRIPCAEGQCLAQAPGTLVTGPVEEDP